MEHWSLDAGGGRAENPFPSTLDDKVELGMEVGCLLQLKGEWQVSEAVIFKGGVKSPDWLPIELVELIGQMKVLRSSLLKLH